MRLVTHRESIQSRESIQQAPYAMRLARNNKMLHARNIPNATTRHTWYDCITGSSPSVSYSTTRQDVRRCTAWWWRKSLWNIHRWTFHDTRSTFYTMRSNTWCIIVGATRHATRWKCSIQSMVYSTRSTCTAGQRVFETCTPWET